MMHDVTPVTGIRIPAIAGVLATVALCDVPDVADAAVSSAVADNFSAVDVHGVFAVACNPSCCRYPHCCWRPCCVELSAVDGVPLISVIPAVVGVLAVASVSAVACVPAVVCVSAVSCVLAGADLWKEWLTW